MTQYCRSMSLFSYLFGFIALCAILVDDKKDKLYSFNIWQAFLLNVLVGMLLTTFYVLFVPDYILSLDVELRTSFLLNVTLITLGIIAVSLLILGIMSYKEMRFNIPLLAPLAKQISKLEVT